MRLTLAFCLLCLSCLLCNTVSQSVYAQQDSVKVKKPELKGYVKYLPSARLFKDTLNEMQVNTDQLVHNRLNFRWEPKASFGIYASVRTRVFYGSTLTQFPEFSSILEEDMGAMDLSHVVVNQNTWLLHTMSDRLYLDFKKNKWQVSVGRQRINWGINTVSNPNDLFNNFSFFDFDYEERPGSDAVRVQYYASELSRVEFAYSPKRNFNTRVAAMLYAFNYKSYDFQLISGYFNDRMVLGGGWAGSIKGLGFKGEFSYFNDINPVPGIRRDNLVAATGIDYRFTNGLYIMSEYLYNQMRSFNTFNPFFAFVPFSADNLSFTEHAVFAQGMYPISMIMNVGLAGFYYPQLDIFFAAPTLSINLGSHFDLLFITQVFAATQGSVIANANYNLAAWIKWSF
jgi:hypothetical protein